VAAANVLLGRAQLVHGVQDYRLEYSDEKEDNDEGKSDQKISLNEFKNALATWVNNGQNSEEVTKRLTTEESKNKEDKYAPVKKNDQTEPLISNEIAGKKDAVDVKEGEDEKEEEEEEEEQYWHLTDTEIKIKAVLILLTGTAICTIVSDPMVDVISNIGTQLNISPFYISFIITPLASNASEVIAGLVFARKKTSEGITLTLSSLHGGATMNSTLALCIFMSLVYFRQLSWSFSAEVITVIFVILAVAVNALKTNIFLWQAIIVGSLYPLSIVMVYVMETFLGLD